MSDSYSHLPLAELNRLIEIDPTRIPPYLARAQIYAKQGQYDRAIDDYTHVLAREPKNTTALFNRGKIYLDKEKHAKAVEDYQALIQINPAIAEAYHDRGVAQLKLGRFQAARQDLTQAIKLKPNYASAYHHRGVVSGHLEDYDAAIGDLDQAIQLDETSAKAHYDRALAYSKKYDYETALACYLRAIELDPTLDRPYYNIGMVLVRLNRFDAALPYLRKALQMGDLKARRVIDLMTGIQHEAEGTSFVVSLADSYQEIKALSKYHPSMTTPAFIRILRHAIEHNPVANTPKSWERLAWLQQLSDSQPTDLQRLTSSLEPSPKSRAPSIAPGDSRNESAKVIWAFVGLAMGLIVAAIWARAGVTVWAVVGAVWGGVVGAAHQEYRTRQTKPESFETAGGGGGVVGGCGLIFGWLGLLLMAAILRISIPEMPGHVTTSLIVGSIGGAAGGMIVGTGIERVGLLLIRFIPPVLVEQAPPSIKKARGILGLLVWLYGGMIVGWLPGAFFGLLYGLMFDLHGVFGIGVGAGIVAGSLAGASVGLIASIIVKFRAQDSVKASLYDAIFGVFGGLAGGSIFEYIYRIFPS